MIAANELRIGNWVNFYYSISKETKYFQIDCQWFASDADQKDTLPIPLTPEVLEKCGFNRESDLDDWTHGYKFQTNSEFILISRNDTLYYIDAINVELKSLHQLQNLYFALTGEELIYKP
jgi:hypothetical protein